MATPRGVPTHTRSLSIAGLCPLRAKRPMHGSDVRDHMLQGYKGDSSARRHKLCDTSTDAHIASKLLLRLYSEGAMAMLWPRTGCMVRKCTLCGPALRYYIVLYDISHCGTVHITPFTISTRPLRPHQCHHTYHIRKPQSNPAYSARTHNGAEH